jgi:hypothetical protein
MMPLVSKAIEYPQEPISFDLVRIDELGRYVEYYPTAYTSSFIMHKTFDIPKPAAFIISSVGGYLVDHFANQYYFNPYGLTTSYVSVSLHF